MNRAEGAAVIAAAVLSLVGCGDGSEVARDSEARAGTDPSPSSSSSSPSSPSSPVDDAARSSVCATNGTTGDSLVIVDWVDFVWLDGIEYIAGLGGEVPPIPPEQLGPVVGRVECQYSVLKFQEPPEAPPMDGDAAFLEVGTEVHAVPGFDTTCRVAAQIDGVNRVYLAQKEGGRFAQAVPCAKAP